MSKIKKWETVMISDADKIQSHEWIKLIHPKNSFQEISEAIYLLELAFRLQEGFRDKLINETCFTRRIILDTGTRISIQERGFNVVELDARFHNLVLSAIATLTIAVDKALNKKFGGKNPDKDDSVNSLRNVLYMLRCAFAHDVIWPKWEVKETYKHFYKIIVPEAVMQQTSKNMIKSEKIFEFDFTSLNGETVTYGSFHGIDGLICFTIYALNLCEQAGLLDINLGGDKS